MHIKAAMRRNILSLVAGVLLVVAVVLVFIPELRTPPMRLALGILWVITAGSTFWRLHRARALTMTLGQIHQMAGKPKFGLLHSVSLLMGVVAIIATAN